MADTLTPNIGALVADPNDPVNYTAHIGNNWTLFDSLMGLVKCTSITRPSNTYGGQGIFETDTGRVAVNTNTKASPTWTYVTSTIFSATSTTRPTLGLVNGLLIYENDTRAFAIYTGGVWRYVTTVVCTSSTRPTGILSFGVKIFETDTGRELTWNGTVWVPTAFSSFVCTSSTHPASPFQGLEIYETDTGMSAVYTGSYYAYGWQQIAPTQVLGGTTASVTFSSIPAVPRLMLVWRVRCSDAVAAEQLWMRMNADSAAHYLWEVDQAVNATVAGTTSGALAAQIQIGTVPAASATAGYFGSGTTVIDGANDTVNFPTAVGNGTAYSSATSMWTGTYGGLYNQVGPVTSVTVLPQSGSFLAKSAFTLYAGV